MVTRIFLSNLDWSYPHNPTSDVELAKQLLPHGQEFIGTWTCANIQTIKAGDRAYFKRVGREPRGFFARGFVIPAEEKLKRINPEYSYLNEAYDSEMIDGQFMVAFEWTEIVDYDKPLDTSWLKKQPDFSGAFFDPRGSGSTFNAEYADLLDHYWEAHLLQLMRQGCAARKR
ncbi:MAG TPA: hypothetical protein V6D16_20230 [Candidatus Obscuribacterales bacterium]